MEGRSVPNESLLADGERNVVYGQLLDPLNWKHFLCLLDMLLPIVWCVCACMGSMVTIIVNFLFMLFYVNWINYSGCVKRKIYAPSLIVILSLVYSVVYVLVELILFYLTKGETLVVNTDVLKYFDIVVWRDYGSELPRLLGPMVMTALLDAVWLIVSNIVDLMWFRRAKDNVLKRMNRVIGVVFMCSVATLAEIFVHKYSVAVQLPFLVICFVYGLVTRELNRTIVRIFWSLFLFAILGYVVVVSSDLIVKLDYGRIPRWVHVFVSFVAGFTASVYCGRNRSRCTVRLIGMADYPIWIRGLAPLVVIVTSFYFCIRQVTWISFVSFVLASVVCFLSSDAIARLTPFVFAVTVVLVAAQTLTGVFVDVYHFQPLGLYGMVGLSALFLSNSRQTTLSPADMTTNSVFVFILSLLSTLLIIAQYCIATYLALGHETLVVNIVLFLLIVFALFGCFNVIARVVVMGLIILTSSIQIILMVLVEDHSLEINESIYKLWFINKETVWAALWGPLLLFFISFFMKYVFVPPAKEIVFVVQHLLIPVMLVATIIFVENSVFELIYLIIVISLLLFNSKDRSQLVVGSVLMDLVVKICHLAVICLYHFEGIRNRVHSSLVRLILGFPQDGKPKNYTLQALLLTGAILLVSLRSAFAISHEHRDKRMTTLMKQVMRIVKHLFSMFSFYILMLAIFLGDVIDYSSSIVQILFLLVMSCYRMITRKGGWFAFIIFLLFAGAYLMQIFCAMIPMSPQTRQIFALIGPSVDGYLSHAVNILAVIASIQYVTFDPARVNLPGQMYILGRIVARNLVVVVQIILAVTALQTKRIIAPISAILCIFFMLKQKMTRAWANFMTIVMLLINTYVMIFAAYPINDVNKWLVYCMVNSTTSSEMSHSFFHLLFTTMLMEYGVGLEPGFGRTVLTAYGFVIVSALVFVLGCLHHDLVILLHLVCWIVVVFIGIRSIKTRVKGVYLCLVFCVLVILVKSMTGAPFWPSIDSNLNLFLSLASNSNKVWIVMFALEFLLLSMLRSEEYRLVQENQERRAEFRTRRQKIIHELYDIDGVFMNNYFEYKLNSVKADFAALDDISAGTRSQSRDFLPPPDAEDPPVIPLKVKLVRVLKNLWFLFVDTIIFCLMQLTDINLEPGISEPGLNRLRVLMNELLQIFEEQKKVIVPQEWCEFARSIPYSFAFRFGLVAKMKMYQEIKEERLLLFKRYFNSTLRVLVPMILLCLQIFYPVLNSDTSMLALIWVIMGFATIGFKIHTYTHCLIYSTIMLLLRYILQLPYAVTAVAQIRESQEEKERQLPLFALFGLNVAGKFAVDALIFALSVISMALVRQHPQIPNQWVGKNGFRKLYSRFGRFSARKISCNIAITIIDLIGFLTLFICYSSWFAHGGTVVDMVSGTSAISPVFVVFLMIHFVFLIAINMAHMSRSVPIYSIISLLDCCVSMAILLFLIPYTTSMACIKAKSFQFMLFTRLLSQMLMGVQMAIGFARDTPRLSNKNPLFVWVYETLFLVIPFLLPIVTCMKWIASGTSIGIFDYLIFEELKAKLKRQRAALVVFKKEPERTRLKGFLLLVVMLALLFVPLVIMSSTQNSGIVNPASIASVSFGLSGLPNIYENHITIKDSMISRADRESITELDDESLIAFSSMSLDQIQVVRLPFSSMNQWIPSPDAMTNVLDLLSDDKSSIAFFGSVTFGFQKSTSENKVQNVKFDLYSNALTRDQRESLKQLLDGSNSTVDITIERLLPMFYQVGYSSEPTPVAKYSYDVTFRSTNVSNAIAWEMDTRPDSRIVIPEFMQTGNETVMVLWSGKSMGSIAGSLLSSAGGLLGLYSFILVTIGVWVSNWVSSHFTDLWITRMAHPEKLLMMLLALEAYKITGDSLEEYKLAQNLLSNLRSTTRIIEITNVREEEEV